MPAATESLSETYRETAQRVRQLHAFLRSGEGDSQEADDLRDELDGYWTRLTDGERARIRGLSADLNMLDHSYPRSDDPADGERFNEKFIPAQTDRDWDRVLELMRAEPGEFPVASTAFLKGVFWARLGDLESALVLFQEAVRIEPTNPEFVMALLRALVSLKRPGEASEMVIAISNNYKNIIPNHIIISAKNAIEAGKVHEKAKEELRDAEGRLHEARRELDGVYTDLFEVKRAILQAARDSQSGRSLFGDDEAPDDGSLAVFAA